MPYVIRRVKNNCYSVRNKQTGRIASTCTTLEKAKKQIRLLQILESKN